MFLGLILSLVFLEIFLQSASFTVYHIKNYKTYYKYKTLKTKDSVKILCIGESTTGEQYPIQLQKILDNISPGRFSVIDRGYPGLTLKKISETIEANIKKYNPDIIIYMMGINDGFYSPVKTSFNGDDAFNKTKIKTYKFFLLLKMHILSKINRAYTTANSHSKDSIKDNNDIIFKQNKLMAKSNDTIAINLTEEGKKEYTYLKLTQSYYDSENNAYKGYEMAVKGLNMNFIKDKKILYAIILQYNIKHGNTKALKFYADMAIKESVDLFKNYYAYFIYGFIKDMISDEQKKQVLSVMPRKDQSYGLLAIESLKEGNFEQSDKYFMLAEELRLNFPDNTTYDLYKSIIKKTIIYKKKIICMQYPVRSVESLKNMLKNEDYYDKITFVSNEETFKEALKKYDYKDIFEDQFAGDFGHCMHFGNKLIAENAAKVIIEITKK
ncbi:MAG: hypothetical protein PHI20_01540 [Endomicrobiaceae bacterium]|nr:hypothetical protein [Endomicrobiaceae bacterium]